MPSDMLTRAAVASASVIDEETRTARLSFSSEEPYTRSRGYGYGDPWVEVLGHGKDEVDLSRLNAGAPLLLNHDAGGLSGHIGVVERAWIENGRGVAEVRITKAADAEPVWSRILEGTLRNASVGYTIMQRSLTREGEKSTPDEYRVTRWQPLEISIVTIPADSTVGVGRSNEDTMQADSEVIMPTEATTAGDGGTHETPVANAVRTAIHNPSPPDVEAVRSKAAAEAVAAERARIAGINKAVRAAQLPDEFGQDLIASGVSVDEARAAIIEKWAEQGGPNVIQSANNGSVRMGEDASDKFTRGASEWLMARSGMQKHDAENEFNGYSLRELLRESLEVRNISTRGLSVDKMLQRAGMHGMSDFPEVVRNVANKALIDGYQEAPVTYQRWTQVGSLSDFKTAYRVDFGGFDNMRSVPRGGEVKYVTTSDGAETIALATYAEKFAIDRQTIIDDDVTAFSRAPARFGEAAAGTANEIAYGILTANGTMSDGVALFHSNHGNLLSAAAITTTSVDAMRVAMATQRRRGVASDGRAMNIDLSYLLVPKALEGAALTLRESQFEITASGRTNTTPNSQRNRFEVVADAYLDDDSATAWYGAAARETVEMAFLNGIQTPTLMRMETTNILGIEWLVYIDIGAAALNWRTLAKTAAS